MSLTENKTIVIPNDGHYTITFGMGFQDASPSPNSDVAMRIVVNGVELAGSYIEYDISDKQDADTWLEHMTHAELNKDDELEMQYIASDTDVTITQDDTYATQGFVASGLIMETPE